LKRPSPSREAAPGRFVSDRRYADPKLAGHRLWQHAKAASRLQSTEPDRVYTEQVNSPFLFKDGAIPGEYRSGMDWLIAEGCIEVHESGCYFALQAKAHALFEPAAELN